MKAWNEVLLVLVVGSIWGVVELAGAEFLQILGMANKSGILFVFAFFILMGARPILRFKGSVLLAGAVAAFYKTLSVNFFPCMVAGIMADAAVIELLYLLASKERLNNWKWRTGATLMTCYAAFTLFAVVAVLILREPHWVERGLAGIGSYIFITGSVAAILSLIVIHPAYAIAKKLEARIGEGLSSITLRWVSAVGILLIVAIWLPRLVS